MPDHSQSSLPPDLPPGTSHLPIIGESEKVADPKLVEEQKELVAAIKEQAAQQEVEREAKEIANNIVPATSSDLEKQRRFAIQVDAMVIKRLQDGAVKLEKLVTQELRQGPAGDITKAHAMMEQAKCLRIAMEFIKQG